MLKLISILLIMYAVQNSIYYISISSKNFSKKKNFENFSNFKKNLFLEEKLEKSEKFEKKNFLEEKFEKEKKNELWNCVTLKLGGNIGPSVKYKNEYWRILLCFFLHENSSHLFLNVLMIFYYRNSILKKEKKNFYFFLLISIFNANLTSNLFYPNFLKIGSSFLSSVFLMLNFLKNFGKKNFEFFLDFFLLCFLVANIMNSSVDNTVHFFGLFSSFIFWIFLEKKINFFYFYCFSTFYALIVLLWINFSEFEQNEQFVAQVNYGCPNSFLELINSNLLN